MLQHMRENFRSLKWTLWLVVAAFVLGLTVVPSTCGGPGGPTTDRDIAWLDGEAISIDDYRRVYEGLAESYRRSLGEQFNADFARQLGLPRQALQQLMSQKIMVQEARRLGLTVSNLELRREILEIPYLVDDKGAFVGEQQYANVVRALEYPSIPAFERALREDILMRKLRSALAANIYVSDAEVEARYRKDVERAKIRYLELPANRFANEATVADAELAPYFEAHREEYRKPEQRGVSYLLVDQNKLRASLEVSDSELATYYEEHRDEFTQEEQVRARHVLVKVDDQRTDAQALTAVEAAKRRLAGGEDFAKVAAEVSEDPGSKDRGGDLGFFGRGRMVPEFEQAAYGAEIGQVVGPVKTSFGYHLIEVLAKKAGGLRPFEEVKNLIRARLQSERAQSEAEGRAKTVAQRIKDEKLTSDEKLKALAAEAPYYAFEKVSPFGEKDPVPNVGRVPEFAQAAFSLKVGEMSEPIKIPRGWLVLRVDEIKEPRIPELSEVTAQVRSALARKKQGERVRARLEVARSEVGAGKSLDQLATELGVEVKDSEEFGAGQPVGALGVVSGLAEAALALPAGGVGGPIDTRTGGLLFQVVDRKTWNRAGFEAAKDTTRATLEREEVNRLLSSLLTNRRRELSPTWNPTFLTRFGIDQPDAES
ncbi:MAG TPA: peptidyl-prolyl cis-trans isomerase [Thermoanaerobaculia bacterium]|nr:peptidyl-prolyl cis-trans isomerase [Thermoanaerobaculia bacterium]